MSNSNKSKSDKNQAVKEIVNKKPCAKCIHFTSGISFGYEWKDCKKNWSDKKNGMFYGVIKDTCDNHHFKKEAA